MNWRFHLGTSPFFPPVNAEWSEWGISKDAAKAKCKRDTDTCYVRQEEKTCDVLGSLGGNGCYQQNHKVETIRDVSCFHGEDLEMLNVGRYAEPQT